MKVIDVKTWKRKVPYENFIKYSNPIFSLTTRLDVTDLYNRSKKEKTSFFADFLFVVTKCMNSVEELRLRISGDKVVLFDVTRPNYIVMSDEGVIVTCSTDANDDYAEFYKSVRSDIERAKHEGTVRTDFNRPGANDCFYVSCMPWVDLVAVNNPYDYKNADNASIPRLAWGKATEENGRRKMMFDIAAHHALLDGEPICRVMCKIQHALDNLDEMF